MARFQTLYSTAAWSVKPVPLLTQSRLVTYSWLSSLPTLLCTQTARTSGSTLAAWASQKRTGQRASGTAETAARRWARSRAGAALLTRTLGLHIFLTSSPPWLS